MATEMSPFAARGAMNGTTHVTVFTAAAGQRYVVRVIVFDNLDTATKTFQSFHKRGGTRIKFSSDAVGAFLNRTVAITGVVFDGDQGDVMEVVMTTAVTTTTPNYLVGASLYT